MEDIIREHLLITGTILDAFILSIIIMLFFCVIMLIVFGILHCIKVFINQRKYDIGDWVLISGFEDRAFEIVEWDGNTIIAKRRSFFNAFEYLCDAYFYHKDSKADGMLAKEPWDMTLHFRFHISRIRKRTKIDPMKIETEPYPVIFLDIDGVMNSEKAVKIPEIWHGYPAKTVGNLPMNNIALEEIKARLGGDAKIVLSSTWRRASRRCERGISMKNSGIDVYDRIRIAEKEDRGLLIKEYIEKHQIKNYVVIDDEYFDILEHIDPKDFIKTDLSTGLTLEDVEKWTNRRNA